jgi:hypothetical protein
MKYSSSDFFNIFIKVQASDTMFSVRAPVHYEPETVLQEKRMIEKTA